MYETLFAFAPRLTDFLFLARLALDSGYRTSRVFRLSSDICLRLKE